MTTAVCPDMIEPVVAWRSWRVHHKDGAWRLQSVIQTADWEPGVPLEAGCQSRSWGGTQKGPHLSPNKHCQCGIYAGKNVLPVLDYVVIHPHPIMAMIRATKTGGVATQADRVFGAVKLWGKIVEYTAGYRGLYAYPHKLWVIRRTGTELPVEDAAFDLLAYNVPVDVLEGGSRDDLKARLEHIISDETTAAA